MVAPQSAEAGHPAGLESPEAQAHFSAGMEAWLAEDYVSAKRELEAAYALEPAPKLLYSLGQLARLQGDCEEAIRRFEAFLDEDPAPAAAQDTRVNIERCRPEPQPQPQPIDEAPVEPAAPPPPPPPRAVRPDALGLSLTVGGAVLAGVGFGLLGGSFRRQQRAEQANTVSGFDAGLRQARTMHDIGVTLAAAGGALIVTGAVRLVMVRRRAHKANRDNLSTR